MSPHCWNHKTSSTKRLNNCTCVKQRKTWVLESCSCDVKSNVWKKERGKENKTLDMSAYWNGNYQQRLKSFHRLFWWDWFWRTNSKISSKFGTYTSPLVFLLPRLYCLFFSHLTKVIWMSLVGITSSAFGPWRQGACVCLSVVAGHGSLGTVAVWGSGTVILAMYTFIVGPWLPASSAISADLIHKPTMKTKNIT